MNPDRFLDDVLAKAVSLRAVVDAHSDSDSPLAALNTAGPAGRRVVLIGMGSSRYAALTAAAVLRTRGVPVAVEYASTDLPTPPAADVTAVGISASGTSAETVAALAAHHGRSRTIAVTADPASPLAAGADVVLPLHSRAEEGGVSCLSFPATLAVLLMLAGATPRDLAPAVSAQARLLEERDAWLEPLLAQLTRARHLNVVAPASRISSALQSALMFREGPRIAAAASETGDWSHVDVYLSRYPDYCALLYTGSAHERELMEWAVPRRSSVIAVGRPVDGATLHIPFAGSDDRLTCALVESTVAELAAGVWWRRRTVAGLMP